MNLSPQVKFKLVLLIILLLGIALFGRPAKASWLSSYNGPNSGYCASARPGMPTNYIKFKNPTKCPGSKKEKRK